jgi:exopolysaccharide production protein ExoQ
MLFMNHTDSVLRPVTAEPSRLEWIAAVFVVIIQQGAFVSIPLVLSDPSSFALQDVRNPFNTAGIVISAVAMGIFCFPWIRQIGFLASYNKASLLFMLMVLMSVTWSIHPDLTIRRGVGYVLTMLIAAYLTLRFEVVDRMKVLSAASAIAAVSSVAFVAALPEYGIMQDGDLAGAWRGVFAHKNHFGPVMAVAVFVELFLLVAGRGRPRWRFASLSTYFALVVLSHSDTALLLSLAYVAGAGVYLLWQRDRLMGVGISIAIVSFLCAAVIVVRNDPTFALGVLGRDTTLTGRTELWQAINTLIEQRPVLGWGYRAMFQANDASTAVIERVADWGAGSSHNAFLEITLELGLVGAGLMLVIIVTGLRRGLQCCIAGILPLGWFSLLFFVGAILAGQTIETLGENQLIEWLVFNVLIFSCGPCVASCAEAGPANVRRRLARTMTVAQQ